MRVIRRHDGVRFHGRQRIAASSGRPARPITPRPCQPCVRLLLVNPVALGRIEIDSAHSFRCSGFSFLSFIRVSYIPAWGLIGVTIPIPRRRTPTRPTPLLQRASLQSQSPMLPGDFADSTRDRRTGDHRHRRGFARRDPLDVTLLARARRDGIECHDFVRTSARQFRTDGALTHRD